MSKTTLQEREFTLVMRGTSAVVFPQNDKFVVENFPSSVGVVNIVYTSRWVRIDENVTIPGHLWIEVKGIGTKLDDVLIPFANAGLALLSLFSLSANAAIGDPDIELVFDSSQEANERDYVQNYVPPESMSVALARKINIKETKAMLDKLNQNAEGDRIIRAANQYRLALESWKTGRETLSLAHLWMALEVLTKSRIRHELITRSIKTAQELADSIGVELIKLDSTVRRDLILNGDDECYRKSKKASDGLEHGFLAFDKIHDLARNTRHRMAQYIREEIFRELKLDEDTYGVLTNDPFDKPLGYWPLVKSIRGKLIGNNSKLAMEGNSYPFLKWKPSINSCEVMEGGNIDNQFNENFTPELGEGIKFSLVSYEVWNP